MIIAPKQMVIRLLEKYVPTVGKKIALAVSLVLLCFGTAFVLVAQRTGASLLREHARLRALNLAELMEVMVEHAMLEGQPGHARHALRQAASTGFVRNAYFLSNSGAIVYQTDRNDAASAIALDRLENLSGPHGEKYYSSRENDSLFEYIVIPVVKRRECFSCHTEAVPNQGYFAMKLAVDDLRVVAADHRLINILMTVVTFLGLGGVLYVALSAIVVRPIRRLHAHLSAVRGGLEHMERGTRVLFPLTEAPAGTDEIAGLRRDFNSLVGRLNEAYASLSEIHSTQLEQADRLATTGQMAASMAHEIKNPLAGVLGALQVFESEMPDTDERREIIAEMKLQLERVNHAVNDLLAYARPAPPVFEATALHPVIDRTLSLLRRQAEGREIDIRVDFPDDGIVVTADRKQLQQMLWNVLLNGMQAMDGGGMLMVIERVHDTQVEILVGDTGNGIAPEHLARIFEPFFTTRHRGTGLGMTITRRIVEQHHGRIDVASDVGKGTTVRIRLPIRQDQGRS